MKKIAEYLENILILNLSLLLIAGVFNKQLAKIACYIAIFIWLLIQILKLGSKAYLAIVPDCTIKFFLLYLFIAVIISTLFSIDPVHSQGVLFERYIIYFMLFYIGYYLISQTSPKKVSILFYALVISGLIIGIGGVLDYLLVTRQRILLPLGKHINIAGYLCLYLPFNIAMVFFSRNKLLKIGSVFTGILLLLCFIWGASRATWIAVPASVIIVVFLKNKKISIYMFFALIIGFFLLSPQLKYRAVSILDSLSWGARLELWRAALMIFKDFPIAGIGPGMYENIVHQYSHSLSDIHLHAHNTYIEVAAELGVIGFLLFLGVFAVLFKELPGIFKKERTDDALAFSLGSSMAVLSVLIAAFAVTNIIVGIQDAAIFWLIFGVAAGYTN